jgi:hypothetical protein
MDSFESTGALNLTFAGAADGVVDNGTPGVVFRGLLEGRQVYYYSASDEKSAANEEKVTDIAAMAFDQIKNLTKAIKATSWIQSNTKIKFSGTSDELRALSENFRNGITDLELSKVERGFAFDFGQLPNLRAIDLGGCRNVTDATVASLAACLNLHTVNLNSCFRLTDAAVTSLAACPNLRTVNLSWCNNLTDAAATALAACPNLHTVDLSECWNLTAAARASLAHCPDLYL